MDFKRLASFMKVAEVGSLSRAADRMRIAQPALSRQMRLLEDELGVQLFARHHRGMLLTKAGEELRARIAGPLRQIGQVVDDIRSLSEETGGNIAFGMPPTVSTIMAGPLARRVAERAPGMSLRVVEGYAAHLLDWLQRGELDSALLYGPAPDLQLRAEALLVEDICLIGPPASALGPDRPVAFHDVAQLPLVLPSRPHGLRVVADHAATKARVALQIRFQADSFVLMKELVEAGLGYTLMPVSAVQREIDAGRLCYAPIVKPNVRRQLVLATQPGSRVSRATQTFDQLVRQEIAALVGAGRWAARLMFEAGVPAASPGSTN